MLTVTLLAHALLSVAAQVTPVSAARLHDRIVVTNRGAASISVIDVASDQVIGTHALPTGPRTPEPMYVVYSSSRHRVLVGDRGNDRVVVFDARDFSVATTVPAGAGVFHMAGDWLDRQVWVNNDVDKTSTVFDPRTLRVLATVPTPADLVALGGRPHDVVLEPFGTAAFITVIGVAGANDWVVRFDTRTFRETGRAAVGKDPHAALTWRNDKLYVPAQGASTVHVLDRGTMRPVVDIAVPNAHGAGMTWFGDVLYTTNIAGGGAGGLVTIDTSTNRVAGPSVDTAYPTPHNVATTLLGDKVYVTHSGATSDKVTVYRVGWRTRIPAPSGELTVGLNPFGIAYLPF